MGSAPILPDKVTDTIDTMLSLYYRADILNIGTCEQGFIIASTVTITEIRGMTRD